jgi:hypothetical protein
VQLAPRCSMLAWVGLSGLANDGRTLDIDGEKTTMRGVWQANLDSEHHPV